MERTSPHPAKLARELRHHLIDLQLAEDPHAELIAQVYARLTELEVIVGTFTHPSVSTLIEGAR